MQLNTLGVVHEFLKQNVREGAFCIDATAGKGRDTALLCRLAGETGRVLAFDIQQDAVDKFARAFGETKPHSLDDMIREAEKKRVVSEVDAAIEAKEKEER